MILLLKKQTSDLIKMENYFSLIDFLNLNTYLNLSYLIFLIVISGIIFNYKNFLVTMLSIELMYLGIISGFIVISVLKNNFEAQIYSLLILIVAASESAIGLGMLIVLFRYGKTVEFSAYHELRG